MSQTPNLQLPFLDANQNQKTVTHNAALTALDALVNCQVQSASLTAPPGTPADGQCWIVASGGTGAWAGKDLNIAAWQDGAWSFYRPTMGMLVYNDAQASMEVWTGSAWAPLTSLLALLGVTALGIGAAPDPANPLSAALNNALLNALATTAGGTGDVRFKLNKQATPNTASFLFQDGFSGRAEIGLCGDDSFHFKVSPDGTTFRDALVLAASSGAMTAAYGLVTPSLNGGPLGGFHNRLVNGSFTVNQRAVSGTVTLAAGAYGHDGWKAGAAGCTYTVATSGADNVLTITAGSLLQTVENLAGGTYTVSQAGTAQARVYQGSPSGSYAPAPFSVVGLAAATNVTIEFSTGTLSQVQFEPGSTATAFERRPLGIELGLCQRLYRRVRSTGLNGQVPFTTGVMLGTTFPPMRAMPTCTLLTTTISGSAYQLMAGGAWLDTTTASLYSTVVNVDSLLFTLSGFTGLTVGAAVTGNVAVDLIALSAEL